MYKRNLKQYGASSDDIELEHRTRFKYQLLNLIPGPVAAHRPKCVTLTLDGEVGRALFQACLHSAIDDNTIIRDAARRIRNLLTNGDAETFDGDLSRERHNSTVPKLLVHFLTMVMDGYSPESEEEFRHIPTNIAELIR